MDELVDYALEFPEAWVDYPWDSRVVKVRKKLFAFIAEPDAEVPNVTVKVPDTVDHALSLPGAQPTGYGLGRHGWVTIDVAALDPDEREVLFDFIDESYRTVAPKSLVRLLDETPGQPGG